MKSKKRSGKVSFEVVLFACLLVSYILLRVFLPTPYFSVIGSDGGRYLGLAKNFPDHTLFNDQVYLPHQVLYPYSIHVMDFLFDDILGARVVSVVSSILLFFYFYFFVRTITRNINVSLLSLFLLTLSSIHQSIAEKVLKEPLALMLTFATLYYFTLLLQRGRTQDCVLSCIAGFLLGLTTDHTLLLFPAMVFLFVMCRPAKRAWRVAFPVFCTAVSYGMWLLVRMSMYIRYPFYPAALDGTIVDTSSWGFRQMLSSHFFEEVALYVPFGYSFDVLHYVYPWLYMFNNMAAPWPSGLSFETIGVLFSPSYLPALVLYSFLIACFFIGVFSVLVSFFRTGVSKNGGLVVLGLFVLFMVPLIQKFSSTRYTLPAIPFMYVILSLGLLYVLRFLNMEKILSVAVVCCTVFALLFSGVYVMHNPYFFGKQHMYVEIPRTTTFLSSLPGTGVMGQVGYTQELAYQTNKRVMALPLTRSGAHLFETFDVSYIVFGGFYHMTYDEARHPDTDPLHMIGFDMIDYVVNTPEKFKLLGTFLESYPETTRESNTDLVYVYEVVHE